MHHTLEENAAAVTLAPRGTARAAVIWLHGLGADGHDFVPLVPELRLPESAAVRFVFPHAPTRPVTINAGMRMRAWYDIVALSPRGPEDEAGIRASGDTIVALIDAEKARGVPANRIVLAGFSQGGAIALDAALRYTESLAGVLALSTYLPLAGRLAAEANPAQRALPILMCHGRFDPMLPIEMGLASRDALQALGYAVEWREYPMQHEVCRAEIDDIAAWLAARFTD